MSIRKKSTKYERFLSKQMTLPRGSAGRPERSFTFDPFFAIMDVLTTASAKQGKGGGAMESAALSSITPGTVTILGDSYSTFEGYNPPVWEAYYPAYGPSVASVEDTWWHRLIARLGLRLLINNSVSGATVCTSVRENQDISVAFVRRMKDSLSRAGVNGERPALILICGGTNDSWIDCPIGELQYGDFTEDDLRKTLPAFCHMLGYVTRENPGARVVMITNCGLKPEITEGFAEACAHYGVQNVRLEGIDKFNNHPTKTGMAQIEEQVERAILR